MKLRLFAVYPVRAPAGNSGRDARRQYECHYGDFDVALRGHKVTILFCVSKLDGSMHKYMLQTKVR